MCFLRELQGDIVIPGMIYGKVHHDRYSICIFASLTDSVFINDNCHFTGNVLIQISL